MSLAQEIVRLEVVIEDQQAVLLELETEILDLQQDVADFQARYEREIVPLEIRLEAVQGAIQDLQAQRYEQYGHPLGDAAPQQDHWQPEAGYTSVGDQYRQTWQQPQISPDDSPVRQGPIKPTETNIKKLYRQLARRYHPDLATDPAERAARHDLMARINEAYAQRDLAALQALAHQPEDAQPDQPLAALRLQELQQINRQLARRIQDLRLTRADIQLSDIMRLALEDKLSKKRGRDLLAEMARQLERETDEALFQLEQLRRA
ncbi:hypothetical protein ACFLYO_10610 [Chloroflexota bacterium]